MTDEADRELREVKEADAAFDRLTFSPAKMAVERWMNEELERGTHPSIVCSTMVNFAAQVCGSIMMEMMGRADFGKSAEIVGRQMKHSLIAYLGVRQAKEAQETRQ